MKLFCAGVGESHPDLTNASRAMKKGEFDDCQKNGVKDIVEIKVGIDGLTIAQSKAGPAMKLTMEQVFMALAEQVPDKDGKLIPNPNKNLVGCRQVAAEHQDRGSRPASDLRHARLLP